MLTTGDFCETPRASSDGRLGLAKVNQILIQRPYADKANVLLHTLNRLLDGFCMEMLSGKTFMYKFLLVVSG